MTTQPPKIRPREQYTLIIEDAGGDGDAPTICRLRRAVKALGRAYAFRVRSVTDTTVAERQARARFYAENFPVVGDGELVSDPGREGGGA